MRCNAGNNRRPKRSHGSQHPALHPHKIQLAHVGSAAPSRQANNKPTINPSPSGGATHPLRKALFGAPARSQGRVENRGICSRLVAAICGSWVGRLAAMLGDWAWAVALRVCPRIIIQVTTCLPPHLCFTHVLPHSCNLFYGSIKASPKRGLFCIVRRSDNSHHISELLGARHRGCLRASTRSRPSCTWNVVCRCSSIEKSVVFPSMGP